MVINEGTKIKSHTSADLYGLLKDSEDITSEDIDAVKIRLKESVEWLSYRYTPMGMVSNC